MSERLTDTQAAVLRSLPIEHHQYGRTARQVALDVWPADPGWHKRTSGRSASRHNGAMGATMPLRAGRVLAGLERRRLVTRGDSDNRWWRTNQSRSALRDFSDPGVAGPEPLRPESDG